MALNPKIMKYLRDQGKISPEQDIENDTNLTQAQSPEDTRFAQDMNIDENAPAKYGTEQITPSYPKPEDNAEDGPKDEDKVYALKPMSVTPLQSMPNQPEKQFDVDAERMNVGAGRISSVLQEALAKRRGNITGRDPSQEIAQIKAGQARLEANLEKRDQLKQQLEEKRAERAQQKQEAQTRSQQFQQEFGLKQQQVGQEMQSRASKDLQAKQEFEGSSPDALAYQHLLIKSGKYKPEDVQNLPANVGKQLLAGQISVEEAKQRAALVTKNLPADVNTINNYNAMAEQAGYSGRLAPGASQEQVEAFGKGLSRGTGIKQFSSRQIEPITEAEKDNQIEALKNKSTATKQAVTKVANEFDNDKKSANASMNDIALIETLLNEAQGIPEGERNAFAAQTLKNRLPRVVGGEKGVMTDKDVERLKGSQTYFNKIKQIVNEKFLQGYGYTDQDLKDIAQTINAIKGNINQQKANLANSRATELKTLLGPLADPAQLLNLSQAAQQSEEKVEVINPQGKRGKIKKSQLDAAIKQGYRLAQ